MHLEYDAVRGHDDGLDVQEGELREKVVPVVVGGVLSFNKRGNFDAVCVSWVVGATGCPYSGLGFHDQNEVHGTRPLARASR